MTPALTFAHALWLRLWFVIPFLAIGVVLEWLIAVRARGSLATLRVNVAATVLFWSADVFSSFALTLFTVRVIRYLPGAGFFPLHVSASTPFWLAFLVACVWIGVLDCCYYWFHRWQHASSWLWHQHSLHHSDPNMSVTTTWRHHWLERPLEAVFVVAPASYIAAPSPAVAAIGLLIGMFFSHFEHANIEFSLGRLWWLCSTPQYHRVHHSRQPEHIDRNFAGVYPAWDLLFGTLVLPKSREYPATGLAHGPSPRTIPEAALWPFLQWFALAVGHRKSRRLEKVSRMARRT